MLTIAYSNLLAMLLVFVRLSAMFLTNPVISRRQVPTTVRMALILVISILVYPNVDYSAVNPEMDLLYVVMIAKEFLIGICISLVFSFFYYMIFFAGDFLDLMFGLAMAKAFDPATNIQVSISGQYLNILFVLYFFATNSHLTMIELFVNSFNVIPMGADFDIDIAGFLLSTFISVLEIIVRLIMPFLVATMLLEVVLGILMKLVPQMHLMVINIQMKIIVGLVMLLALIYPVSTFIDNYIATMLDTMYIGLTELPL